MYTLKIGFQGLFLVLGARRMLTFSFLSKCNTAQSAEMQEGHFEAANYVVNLTQDCRVRNL